MKLLKSTHAIKLALLISLQALGSVAMASDHDDGETSTKGRNVNLTDLYVFRKDWETQVAADASKLILIMNFNPRSLPGQQYYAADNARYEFHATRVGGANANQKRPTGLEDVAIRVYHSAPDAGQQSMTIELVKGGEVVATATKDINNMAIKTTKLGMGEINSVVEILPGVQIKVFEGLREDPFFFDVNAFFKTRSSLASHASNPGAGDIKFAPILTPATPKGADFTKDLNVISLAIEAPISLFQSSELEKTFDFWETISVQK